MPKANPSTRQYVPLYPDRFYRFGEVVRNRYLGVGDSQLREKIKKGEIEPPVALSEGGHAKGYFGDYLLRVQAEIKARAAQLKTIVSA